MDTIDKIEILKKDDSLLNTMNLKLIYFGDSLYLIDNNIKNKADVFLLNVSDSYYGLTFNGSFDGNNIKIFAKNDSKTIILTSNFIKCLIRKETINGKDTVVFEAEEILNRQKNTCYVMISDGAIEYGVETPNQKIQLYYSETNDEKIRYFEQNDSSCFNFKINKKNQKQISISASNLPYFNVNYDKDDKNRYYQSIFLQNTYILETIQLLEQEMIKYFPNLIDYLNMFQVYKNLSCYNLKSVKNNDKQLIDNLLYDGKVIKTLKLKKN